MVREGYFNDVDAVISHHPGTMNDISLMSCLAVNSVKFHFTVRLPMRVVHLSREEASYRQSADRLQDVSKSGADWGGLGRTPGDSLHRDKSRTLNP